MREVLPNPSMSWHCYGCLLRELPYFLLPGLNSVVWCTVDGTLWSCQNTLLFKLHKDHLTLRTSCIARYRIIMQFLWQFQLCGSPFHAMMISGWPKLLLAMDRPIIETTQEEKNIYYIYIYIYIYNIYIYIYIYIWIPAGPQHLRCVLCYSRHHTSIFRRCSTGWRSERRNASTKTGKDFFWDLRGSQGIQNGDLTWFNHEKWSNMVI